MAEEMVGPRYVCLAMLASIAGCSPKESHLVTFKSRVPDLAFLDGAEQVSKEVKEPDSPVGGQVTYELAVTQNYPTLVQIAKGKLSKAKWVMRSRDGQVSFGSNTRERPWWIVIFYEHFNSDHAIANTDRKTRVKLVYIPRSSG